MVDDALMQTIYSAYSVLHLNWSMFARITFYDSYFLQISLELLKNSYHHVTNVKLSVVSGYISAGCRWERNQTGFSAASKI